MFVSGEFQNHVPRLTSLPHFRVSCIHPVKLLYTFLSMRRSVAISLLLWLALAIALPLAVSDGDQSLPPCCRRNGKHHCAMMDTYLRLRASGTPMLNAPPMRCPLYPRQPGFARVCGPVNAALLRAQHTQLNFRGIGKAPQEQPRSLYKVEITRFSSKRGPPGLFL